MVVKEQPVTKEIKIASDLALHQAMTRRALALDLVGLATFGTVMKWTDRLFELLAQQPPLDSSRRRRPSCSEQIVRHSSG